MSKVVTLTGREPPFVMTDDEWLDWSRLPLMLDAPAPVVVDQPSDMPATRAQADDIIALLRQLHAAVTQLSVTMRAIGGRHL